MDLAMQKDYVFALMDRAMEYSLGVAKELIRLGADIIWLGDEHGHQKRDDDFSPNVARCVQRAHALCD